MLFITQVILQVAQGWLDYQGFLVSIHGCRIECDQTWKTWEFDEI